MRKIIAVLMTLSLVFPLLVSTLALVSVNSFILDRDFYLQSLADDQFYDALIPAGMNSIILGAYFNLTPGADTSQIEAVFNAMITRDYLKNQLDDLINRFFDFLQGKTDTFEATVDLMPVKAVLAGEKQDDFLVAIAAILPVCDAGQIPGIDTNTQKACKPAGISDAELAQNYLKPFLPYFLSVIPDTVPLGQDWEVFTSRDKLGIFSFGVALPAGLMMAVIFTTFITVSFWYISALIADESWRTRLFWLGWTLITPSGIIFIAGLALMADIPLYWLNLLIERAASDGAVFNLGLSQTIWAVIISAAPRAAKSFLMVSGISGALGFGLIFWGLVTPKYEGSGFRE